MGTLFGKKKEETLRPLTEKEIQRKLYGEFHGRESFKTAVEPEPVEEIEVEEPQAPASVPIAVPSSAPRKKASPPAVSGDKILSFFKSLLIGFLNFWKGLLMGLLNFLKTVLVKAGTGWGVGILIVVSLFLAIHALNSYRTREMGASRSLISSLRGPEPDRISPRSATPPSSEPEAPVKASLPKDIFETQAPPPAQPKQAATAKKTSGESRYVVQVAIYLKEEDAQKVAGRIATAHFPTFVEPLRRTNGKTLYPVFLGRYPTLREAQTQLREFRKKPIAKDFPDSFVRSL